MKFLFMRFGSLKICGNRDPFLGSRIKKTLRTVKIRLQQKVFVTFYLPPEVGRSKYFPLFKQFEVKNRFYLSTTQT